MDAVALREVMAQQQSKGLQFTTSEGRGIWGLHSFLRIVRTEPV